MRFSTFLLLSLFALSTLKGACKAEQITDSPPPYACPAVFAPVCGADGRTYGNACEATIAKVAVVSEGECPALPFVQEVACDCEDWPEDLVCGSNGQTYNNRCEARCSRVWVVHSGPCNVEVETVELASGCLCPAILAPVCGSDGNSYGNSCAAKCNNVTIVSAGECPSPASCLCPAILAEVCGADGKTYPNACAANCAKVQIVSEGKCPADIEMVSLESLEDGCVCTANVDPVCGTNGKTYSNACIAKCANITIASRGACSTGCVCTANLAPVCGVDGKTYSNACMAKCAGVAVVSAGVCGTPAPASFYEGRQLNGCTCTDEFDPCTGDDGVEYSNPCKARCAGTQCSANGN